MYLPTSRCAGENSGMVHPHGVYRRCRGDVYLRFRRSRCRTRIFPIASSSWCARHLHVDSCRTQTNCRTLVALSRCPPTVCVQRLSQDEVHAEGAPFALAAKDNTEYGANTSADVPLWGRLCVYDSPQEALKSLGPNYLTPPAFVRLVLVADSALLRTLCKHGEEVLSSDTAGLYLQVAPSCPAFYAIWEDGSKNTTHDVRNELDRQASRDTLLNKFKNNVPVSLAVATGIPKSPKGVVVEVNPGVSVPCNHWDSTSEDDDSDGSDVDNGEGSEVEVEGGN